MENGEYANNFYSEEMDIDQDNNAEDIDLNNQNSQHSNSDDDYDEYENEEESKESKEKLIKYNIKDFEKENIINILMGKNIIKKITIS